MAPSGLRVAVQVKVRSKHHENPANRVVAQYDVQLPFPQGPRLLCSADVLFKRVFVMYILRINIWRRMPFCQPPAILNGTVSRAGSACQSINMAALVADIGYTVIRLK